MSIASFAPSGATPRRRVPAAVVVLLAAALLFTWSSRCAADPMEDARRAYLDGRYEEAVRLYRAFAAAHETDAPADAAMAHNNACVLLMNLGDHRTALDECRAALRLRRGLDDDASLARTLNNLGLVSQNLGRYDDAGEAFREALELSRAAGDAEAQAVHLANLAGLATVEGRYALALARHEAVAELARRHAGEPWAAAQRRITRINRGVVLEKLEDFSGSLELYRRVMTEAAELTPRTRASVLVNMGVAYRNLGDPVRAVESLQQAVRLYEAEGDTSGLSNALLNLGVVRHLNLGQPGLAEDAYRAALTMAEASGDRTEEIQDLYYLGRLLLEQGRLEAAAAMLERCLSAAEESGSAEGRWSSLEGLGRLAAARGERRLAVERFEAAMEAVETVRASLADLGHRSGYFGAKRTIYAAAVDVLWELERSEPGQGHAAHAFHIAQRAKARDLMDATGAAGRSARPATAAELAPRLGGAAVLEYFLGEQRLFLWVLDAGGVTMHDLGDAAPVLAGVARLHRSLAHGRPADPELVERLSRTLLPVAPVAAGRVRIAPDGRLHYLPFEILRTAGGSGRPLVETTTVSYLPSASALPPAGRRRREPPARVVCFGDPRLPNQLPAAGEVDYAVLQALPVARRELAAVRRWMGRRSLVFLGDEATEAALRASAAEGARVIHLATHTVVDERAGRGSAIVLTPSADDDGLLRPAEISGLEVNAHLTVLAGCRTALGSGHDGQALASLTGSFLGAGSAAVLATLWDVDDAATGAFMDQLYHQLSLGLTPAEALRRAKLRLLADPRWSAPSQWAAYILIGDAPPVHGRLAPVAWAALVAALLLAAGALLAWRRRGRRRVLGGATSPSPSAPGTPAIPASGPAPRPRRRGPRGR